MDKGFHAYPNRKNIFLKYKYAPDYLIKIEDRKPYITDCTETCRKLGIRYRETDIVIDGGNVVLSGDNVVMTEKVFTENNRDKHDSDFLKQIEDTFGHKVNYTMARYRSIRR